MPGKGKASTGAAPIIGRGKSTSSTMADDKPSYHSKSTQAGLVVRSCLLPLPLPTPLPLVSAWMADELIWTVCPRGVVATWRRSSLSRGS